MNSFTDSVDITDKVKAKGKDDFQYGVDFVEEQRRNREEQKKLRAKQREQERLQEIEASKLRFTEAELEAIKKEQFDLGYNQGQSEAQASDEKAALETLKELMAQIQQFDQKDQLREQAIQKTTLKTMLSLLNKLVPEAIKTNSDERILEFIETVFRQESERQRLDIILSEEDKGRLVDLIDKSAADKGITGKVNITTNGSFSHGDCRIDWGTGGIEQMQKHLEQGLLKSLENIFNAPELQTWAVNMQETKEQPQEETNKAQVPEITTEDESQNEELPQSEGESS